MSSLFRKLPARQERLVRMRAMTELRPMEKLNVGVLRDAKKSGCSPCGWAPVIVKRVAYSDGRCQKKFIVWGFWFCILYVL